MAVALVRIRRCHAPFSGYTSQRLVAYGTPTLAMHSPQSAGFLVRGGVLVSEWGHRDGRYPEKDRLTSGGLDGNPIYSMSGGRSAMKTLVVYDSLYGNTKAIAQAIGDAIPGDVEVAHVGDANPSSLPGYDLVIVGAPTHGAKPSPNMQQFLGRIRAPALDGVKVAGFDTRMTSKLITMFGTAAPKLAKVLEEKGGILAGKPAGFYVTGGEGPLKDGEVERAAAWAQGLVENEV